MTLPLRTHYSISEAAQRWGTSMTDMRCYLETGHLQAQAHLDAILVQVYQRMEISDQEEAWIKKSITRIAGYVVVQPEQIRKIFRLKSAPIHKFKAVDGPHFYKLLHEKDSCSLGVDDLWIAVEERDRFEAANYIMPPSNLQALADTKTGIMPFSSGRPSIMKRITEQHALRKNSGAAMPTIAAEAKFLRIWAQEQMPGIQIPAVKTIRNELSSIFAE